MLKMKDWLREIEKLQCKTYSGINHIKTKQVAFVESLVVFLMAFWLIVYLAKYILGMGIIIVLGVYIVRNQTELWCTSLTRCIAMLISLFMGYSLCVIGFVLIREQINKLILILLIIYLTQRFLYEWYRISITSKSDIAKLANELISVCTTLVFTAGTYVESLVFSKVPSLRVIEKSYKSIAQLRIELATNATLKLKILCAYGKLFMEVIFLLLLPILCISLLSTALIDLKDFYMAKYKMEDFWTRMERIQAEQKAGDDTEKEIIE